jgi:TRAP-type C4-dicarboxylate transport system substrate-binding protein
MKQIKPGKIQFILITVLLALVLVTTVLLGACSKASVSTTTSTAATTTTAPPKPITLVFTSHNSGSGFWRENVIDPYFRELERRTNGRVVVEEHWNGELVNLIDAYDAMLKGSVDMAEYFPSMLEPYNDAKLLWREPAYSVGVVTTKTAIRDLASSKGLKIGPVGEWSANLIQALGWVPTPVPPEDSTSALQTGVQDGTGISMYLLWEFGWGPIVHYMTVPINVDSMLVNCSMNINTWNSLPDDIKGIMNDMSEWIVDVQDQAVVKNYFDSVPKAKSEFGIEVINLPKEEQDKMNAAIQPVQDAFVKSLEDKGLPGKDLMAKFLELNRKYSQDQYKPE